MVVSNHAIDKAISNYRRALNDNRNSEEAAVGLMQSYYFKIAFTQLTKEQARELTQQSVNLSEELEKRFPTSGPIHYWSASLWSIWADNHGLIKSCYEGVADRIKTHSEKVVQYSPSYRSSGGHRLLGLVHYYAPRIPLVLNWSSKVFSEDCLTKAVNHSPEHPGNLMSLAKLYRKQGKDYQAYQLLQKILETPPRQDLVMEDKKIINTAQEMLKELKENGQ